MKTIVTLFIILTFVLTSCGLEDEVDKAIISISGNVSDQGAAVSGAFVLLVTGTDVSDGLSLSNGSVTDNSGNFTILGVEAGLYYLVAVDDNNGNHEYDADADRLGFYGVNPDAQDYNPDRITVADSDVENINVVSLSSL